MPDSNTFYLAEQPYAWDFASVHSELTTVAPDPLQNTMALSREVMEVPETVIPEGGATRLC